MCVSFAHGSNDVSNAIGPWSGIYNIYLTTSLTAKSPTPIWMLAIGGLAIGLGFAVLGWVIVRAMGMKIIKISPSKGFVAELSAAIVVIVGSYLGIPLSTTQCIVGAILGVGLVEGVGKINFLYLIKIFFGWIGSVAVGGLIGAAIFSWTTGAPS